MVVGQNENEVRLALCCSCRHGQRGDQHRVRKGGVARRFSEHRLFRGHVRLDSARRKTPCRLPAPRTVHRSSLMGVECRPAGHDRVARNLNRRRLARERSDAVDATLRPYIEQTAASTRAARPPAPEDQPDSCGWACALSVRPAASLDGTFTVPHATRGVDSGLGSAGRRRPNSLCSQQGFYPKWYVPSA